MIKINIIILSILAIIFIFIQTFKTADTTEYHFCLKKNYEIYKREFMTKDGRILDPQRNNITTSEGQSYLILRSLILKDKETFDLAYKWTKNNLQRPDKLFAWLWGKNSAGEYKILDENTASDSDVDIAFALIVAYEMWDNYYYLQEAMPIINAIWQKETKKIGDYLVLMPGVKQTLDNTKIEINPSYFSPFAFRFFQKYDSLHDWNYLIDSSYFYLTEVTKKTQTHLPPNWFLIKNGEIELENSEKSDFSYDAIRVFPRIYLDYVNTGEKRAIPILKKSEFFNKKWKESNKFYTNYKANGELRDKTEYIGSVTLLTPIISMYDFDFANEIYKTKLDKLFNDENYWNNKNDYYGKNLIWFGYYLYNKNSKEFKEMNKMKF